jgi:hypothetical protein
LKLRQNETLVRREYVNDKTRVRRAMYEQRLPEVRFRFDLGGKRVLV